MADIEVFGWQADHAGGYYRIQLPLQALGARGHATASSVLMPDFVRGDANLIIIGQRICHPRATQLWQSFAAEGRRLVFEIDDDLWNIDPSSPVDHKFFGDEEIRTNLRRNIEVAAAVTVTTEPLADRVRQWNPNVHVVPNAVPDWLLGHQPQQRHDDTITLGWGGGATHRMDWERHGGQIHRFLDLRPQTEIHCIGVNYVRMVGVPLERIRFTPWAANVEEYLRTIDYHIGIAPLREHVFNRSKSALKAIECGALGIPVVASAVRPYQDYVQHGITGYLVRRDEEWVHLLSALANDYDMRVAMGEAARVRAAQQTISCLVPLWEKAIFG
ncbi:glycosyltransferase [Streptomyces gibsoniae]|uniref:Glycosyltransferase n=1 Tax=Streptomyces gibsoniae TaxID=3075529 RepID=A0ABU2U8V7_9ACTN|nr:glycosyltransferase [Streptomyces sp. DSM 41699]MDT0469672.1 glycosyltransferase [Streptomyces sp. DSM 41699]